MSKMEQVVEKVKAFGVPVWETWNWTKADVQGKTWTPVGVMVHHTAMSVPLSVTAAQYANRFGGPLCNFIIRKVGQVDLVCDGYAYDSGMGNSQVLSEVKAARFQGGDAKARGLTVSDVSGNPWFIDIEVDHRGDGSQLDPRAYGALINLLTAICQVYGWDQHRVLGHKEWTSRKVDPNWNDDFEMDNIRRDVAIRVNSSRPPEPVDENSVLVLGPASVTLWQMTDWAVGKAATSRFVELAVVAWDESLRIGVDPAVTYAVMAHETGFGGFSNVVPESFHNWGGIKTASGGSNTDPTAHARFANDRIGVRAVAQHLALYAGLYIPKEEVVDPRHFSSIRGKAGVLPSDAWTWASSGGPWSVKVAKYVNQIQEVGS